MDRASVLNVVYNAIDTVNELRSASEQVEKNTDVILAGPDGVLDSLALVTLILTIESCMANEANIQITLLDDNFDEYEERLKTPSLIVDFIMEKLSA